MRKRGVPLHGMGAEEGMRGVNNTEPKKKKSVLIDETTGERLSSGSKRRDGAVTEGGTATAGPAVQTRCKSTSGPCSRKAGECSSAGEEGQSAVERQVSESVGAGSVVWRS